MMANPETAMNRTPARLAAAGLFTLLLELLLAPLAFAQEGMSLQQVALTRSVTDVAIQPQGGAIAYVLSVPRVPGKDKDGPAWAELHVVDMAGHSRAFVSGQVNVAAPRWLPDGGIAFLMRGSADAHRSLYRIPFDGGGAQRVRMLDSDIRNFSVSPDGQQVALVALEPEDPELQALRDKGFNAHVVEEGTRRARVWIAPLGDPEAAATALDIEGSVQSVQWSPAGDRLALVATPNERIDDVMVAARVRIVRARDGRELGRVDNPGKLGQLAWNTDGSQLAIISAQDANDPREGRLTVVGRDGGAQRDLLPGLEGHVWNLQWRDPHRMVFISNEGTATRIGEVDLDGNQRTLLARDTPVYSRLALARDGRLALVGSTPQHPPEVFTLAAGVHAPQRLTDNNPWLADVTLARQEVVRYAARDGLEVEGILVHP